MKSLLKNIVPLVFIMLLVWACSPASRVPATDSAAIKKAIDEGAWKFNVTLVSPQSGSSRQPNGIYYVSLRQDSLNVYLPYFGRAYAGADVLSGENVLDFITKNFDKVIAPSGNHKWEITFSTKEQKELPVFQFYIFDNGNASLNVRMNNRSPISYSGYITTMGAQKK